MSVHEDVPMTHIPIKMKNLIFQKIIEMEQLYTRK